MNLDHVKFGICQANCIEEMDFFISAKQLPLLTEWPSILKFVEESLKKLPAYIDGIQLLGVHSTARFRR